jgi:hypothetical protein
MSASGAAASLLFSPSYALSPTGSVSEANSIAPTNQQLEALRQGLDLAQADTSSSTALMIPRAMVRVLELLYLAAVIPQQSLSNLEMWIKASD